MTPPDVVTAARDLVPRIRAASDAIEAERRLPDDIAETMADARLFTLLTPEAYGGAEVTPMVAMEAVEHVGRADGSAGWLALNGSYEAALLGWLSAEAIEGMQRAESEGRRDLTVGGSAMAQATAVEVEGGYLIDGHWDFVSGVMHSNWILGGFWILEEPGGEKREHADGRAVERIAFMPRSDGEIVDTWDVLGMRGTGSHDFVTKQLFVPAERTMAYAEPSPFPGPRYLPPYHRTWGWSLHAGNSLGIARGAIEDLTELASRRSSKVSRLLLRDRPHVQAAAAEAEAIVRAARAFVFEAVEAAWIAVTEESADADRLNWDARLALTHAVHESLRAVELLYKATGTNAIFRANRLERAFRDLQVAQHHIAASRIHYQSFGSVLLEAGEQTGADE